MWALMDSKKHSYILQTVIFHKDYYTLSKAKKYLIAHDLKTTFGGKEGYLEGNFYRFRQHNPKPNVHYKTIKKDNHIEYVYMWA